MMHKMFWEKLDETNNVNKDNITKDTSAPVKDQVANEEDANFSMIFHKLLLSFCSWEHQSILLSVADFVVHAEVLLDNSAPGAIF